MPSKHANAGSLIRRGFYDDLYSFSELERRIGALGDENTKIVGDAFEVFIEAYLATHQKMQAEAIWLVGQVPPDIRLRLNLPNDPKGIDGVFRTRTGRLVPYQVKFRSQRAYLTYTEIASFLGLTERATDRIVFTNSNELAEDVKNRDAMRTVRGIDFDDLTVDDFRAISGWLRDQPVAIPKLTPHPYQIEALARMRETLSQVDRAHVVMASGTGKTLVALWAAEAEKPRTVLVLVPSLTLLQQTLDEWIRQNSSGRDFTYLCVCSDPTVVSKDTNDLIHLDSTDLDFRVDTSPDEVRRFIETDTPGLKVVFATYHSSPVVSQGISGPFDIAIFDEAHKTTGPQGGLFAHSLSNENIKIRKRLFFTATPRHYDLRHRDKEGDFRIVSMDDEAVYGPRAYTLTFGSAARQGIICNYRVVISVVDGNEINDFALKHGITLVKGDLIGARWVANQIAIERAIEKTGAKRAITFHSRVSSAKEFSGAGSHGVQQFLPEYSVFHVNGGQKSSERKQLIKSFRDAEKALITNARCLTEGIDVPAVDMVAFIDPRHSKIDIAQATGRAMRKPPASDKKVGYVVVPLFLEMERGESLDDALKRSEFDDVASVLNALQEQDEDLVQIIRELKEAKGRGEKFDPRALSDKIEVLGATIELAVLKTSILAEIVDVIGASWDEWYGRLKSYKERFGDCRVPLRYVENGYNLGSWVKNQRRHTLSAERRKRLDDLGFEWDPVGQYWEEGFGHLKSFRDRVGDCYVPYNHVENGFELGSWANHQRNRDYPLSEERRRRLDEIGFVWDKYLSKWQIGFHHLNSYRDRVGNCRVPPKHLESGYKLGSWVSVQRRDKSKLSEDQRTSLEALGFEWVLFSANWEKAFEYLRNYKDRNGDCRVPLKHKESGFALGHWVSKHRRNEATLSADRRKRLDDLGFEWDPTGQDWDEGFRHLRLYRERIGDCRVPLRHVEKGFALGRWVNTQIKRKNRLFESQSKRLADIGFDWNCVSSENWENGFRHLKAYKERLRDCYVPVTHIESGFKLGRWVSAQRKEKNELSEEQKRRLDQLAFDWDVVSTNWEKAFECLRMYKNRVGDCRVPVPYIDSGIKLGRWVNSQRRRKEKLSEEQRKQLDQIGFEWKPRRKKRPEVLELLV